MTHNVNNTTQRFVTSRIADGNMSYRFGQRDEVEKNRHTFLSSLNISSHLTAVMEVAHSDVVRVVESADCVSGKPIEAEALITNDPSVVLFLLTADCLPIGFFDTQTKAFALAHMGWKPIMLGLCGKVVCELGSRFGTHPYDLRVCIGPSISAASYAFKDVSQKDERWIPFLATDQSGMVHVDLEGYVRSELALYGVNPRSIQSDGIDTCISRDHFSHRRSVACGESEGRMATICAYQ